MNTLKELYAYKEMMFSLVRRDLKGRYKGSALGFLWTFINPLLQLGVYTMVFSIILPNTIDDYYMHLFVALIPWIFFSTSLSGGSKCIWSQKEMVKKIYFPREVLPISYVTSQFVNMLLSFLVIFAVLIVTGRGLDFAAFLYLPLIMLIEYVLALSVTMIASAVTVYLRDVEYILSIITLAWQFLTPVMYSESVVPEHLMPIFNLNPMTPVIIAYRDILYFKSVPDVLTLVQAVVLGAILLVIGFLTFSKLKKGFAESL
ncbi:MAG: ABC transporter permease [Lachnospiraceae bacterium]